MKKLKGSEIALATLMGENPGMPCINYSWMTNSKYMSKAAGRDYWTDRERVFFEYLSYAGINFVPQWYFPGEGQGRIELGHIMHEHRPEGTDGIRNSREIL